MARLTDTQFVILSAASQRDDRGVELSANLLHNNHSRVCLRRLDELVASPFPVFKRPLTHIARRNFVSLLLRRFGFFWSALAMSHRSRKTTSGSLVSVSTGFRELSCGSLQRQKKRERACPLPSPQELHCKFRD